MPITPAIRSVSACDPFESCMDDAPVTLQRLVRRRLVRPLMATRMGLHNLRMDAAEAADQAHDDDMPYDDSVSSCHSAVQSRPDSENDIDEQTRDLLRQLGTPNRLLLGR